MKRILPLVLIFLIFLTGIGFVVYPMVSNTLYEKDQSLVLAEYDESLAQLDQENLNAALEAAREYNRVLMEGSAILTDPFDPDLMLDPTVEPYASLLNLAGDGMMGYIEIPLIDVYLPIYHGTTADVLERGIGHLQATPLPVGGEGIHSVLTGHTGLSGKRLFTDLTELELGDLFYLHIAGQTMAYQVDQINIVEPSDTELLLPSPGEDLVTLVTCYPYGINTHRLLVRGCRIDAEQAAQVAADTDAAAPVRSVWQQEYWKAITICLALYIPLTILLCWFLLRRKNKNKPDSRSSVGEMSEYRKKLH